MKVAVVVAVLLAFCAVAAVNSSIFENSHREKLREIRNVCAVQSDLGPFEIGTVIRAIRPAQKLVNTTKCIVQTLVEQRYDDQVAGEILNRIKVAFELGALPKTIKHLIASCEALVGTESCQRVIDIVQLIIASVRGNPISGI